MTSKEPLEARSQYCFSTHTERSDDTNESKAAVKAIILLARIQKTCFMCLIPYVLKKTMMINAQSPKINPPGGCQSFCFGFWKKTNKKRKTKNSYLVFTLNRHCVYQVQKKKFLAVERNTNKLYFFIKQKHLSSWCGGKADGRWAATQAGRLSTTKRPLELCHHFDGAYQHCGTGSNSFVWTESLLSGLMLIREKNAASTKNSSYKWKCEKDSGFFPLPRMFSTAPFVFRIMWINRYLTT